ncbi:MAG: hypothetical protein AVDCRST_MAG37-2809, partial [uncultured Rubrobacteraceae bacterium]
GQPVRVPAAGVRSVQPDRLPRGRHRDAKELVLRSAKDYLGTTFAGRTVGGGREDGLLLRLHRELRSRTGGKPPERLHQRPAKDSSL